MLQNLINELTRLQKLEETVAQLESKLNSANKLNEALVRAVHSRDDTISLQQQAIARLITSRYIG
jgi:hypothetical protein